MENVDSRMIEIRGQRVRVAQASHQRWWSVYQGGEYFEFRPDGAGGLLLSQSAEWDCHDPAHVVGRGPTLQAAAEDFSRSVTRRTGPRPGSPRAARRRARMASTCSPSHLSASQSAYRYASPKCARGNLPQARIH